MPKNKKTFVEMNEDERLQFLGWRDDVMSKYCTTGSVVTKKGGHAIKGTTFLGNRGKRNRKTFS